MRIVIKLLNIISTVIFIAMFALMTFFAPMILGYKPAVILSGSMEPTFPVNSVVYYKSANFSEIAEGEPIIYQKGDALITHRVVEKNNEQGYVITKGDANNTEDSYEVYIEEVKGIVHFMVPYVGYAALAIQNKFIFIMLIAILVLNIALNKLFEENIDNEVIHNEDKNNKKIGGILNE